ncbi:MAG TPA: hypothetical protein VF613_01780 [Longimicrobium sp.]|jgi:hypothetical protein
MTEFSILGRTLRADGLPPPLDAWLRTHWRFDYEVEDAGFSITLEPCAPPPELPAPTAPPVRAPGIELPCRVLGDDHWHIGDERAGVRLRLRAGGSEIAFWGAEPSAALFVAIYESLRASGLVPLHASVLARDGEATALTACSGTGKSSTLVQAIGAGWQPIAEDFAWLEPGSLRLFGWDRGVHLWPDARQRFAAGLSRWAPGPEGKLFLPWDALAEPRPRVARLATLALLERDPARPSAWEPLPPRDAVRALWEAIGVPLSETSRRAVSALLPTLLPRLHLRRLVLGSTHLPL